MMAGKAMLVDGEIVFTDDVLEWARWYEGGDDARRVAETFIGEARVSTVFLGLDHSFGFGPSLWFETMIFGPGYDNPMWRYETLDEARRGHDRVCAMVRGEIPFDDEGDDHAQP